MDKILCCSNCDSPLIKLIITNPDAPVIRRVRAECPYGCCGEDGRPETSFISEVKGNFLVGGIDKVQVIQDHVPVTNWLGTREDGDVLTFLTGKV